MSPPATATIAPHALAAEISALGACLQDPEAVRKATGILTAQDFFNDAHREIFGAIQSLLLQRETIDLITVADYLLRHNQLEKVGGTAYLAHLVDMTPTAANVTAHARLVKRDADLRCLQNVCKRTAGKVKDGSDPAELKAALLKELNQIGSMQAAAKGIDPEAARVVVRLSDVAPEPVSWLWPGRIAKRKLTLIIGDPDKGKSCVTLDFGARITRGLSWPDGTPAPCGNVVLLTAEDGLEDTVRPRLDAMGGDPSRVHVLIAIRTGDRERGFDLTLDLPHLEALIADTKASLVVIDPVSAYLGKTDSYRDSPRSRW